MEASKGLRLTEATIHQLQEGISLLFSRWREIQDAVNQGFGGTYTRERAVIFESSVFNFFIQPNSKQPLYIDDLEELLCDGMDSLGLIPCNDIVEEVAEKLMIMHEECLEGNYQSIQKLREAMPVPYAKQPSKVDNRDLVDDDATPSMMMDSSDIITNNEVASEAMEVDEWVTVTRRKRTGKSKSLNI